MWFEIVFLYQVSEQVVFPLHSLLWSDGNISDWLDRVWRWKFPIYVIA